MKVVTNAASGIVAMGWVDGNPVHFLTSADGTEQTTVNRRVGSVVSTVRAPAAIRRFNHGMQGVDRFDQLVSLFSLAKQHAFKKYYNKLAMGLLDFALVNAELHYFMAHPEAKGQKDHRCAFRQELCRMLYETDWNAFTSAGATVFEEQKKTPSTRTRQEEMDHTHTRKQEGGSADGLDRYNVQLQWGHENFKMAPKVRLELPPSKDVKGEPTCDDPVGIVAFLKRNSGDNKAGLSYEGAKCQICLFEGRKNTTKGVVICGHGVRACSITPDNGNETEVSNLFKNEEVTFI